MELSHYCTIELISYNKELKLNFQDGVGQCAIFSAEPGMLATLLYLSIIIHVMTIITLIDGST